MTAAVPTKPTLKVAPSEVDVADEINAEHYAVLSAAHSAVEHAIRCGELLLAQKDRVGHGHFTSWVKEHCDFSHDTANIYMRATRQKTSALVFSSLRQLLEYERAGQPAAAPPPRAQYISDDQPPDFQLPEGHDAQRWTYSHQTAKRLRWFAKFIAQIDALQVAKGALPEERARLRADVRRIHLFVAELHQALRHMEFLGLEPQPLFALPREEVQKALWEPEREQPAQQAQA